MSLTHAEIATAYLTCVGGCYELHRLDKAGKLDSAEAQEIRDLLDAPLARLPAEQREAVRALSARLDRGGDDDPYPA
jgi:hypothetical protein